MVSFPAREQSTGGVLAFPSPRRVRETPKAAAAYREYEAMGTGRSLAKLVEHLRQSDSKVTVRLRTLEEWSRTYSWVERVAVYDEQQAEIKRKKREAALEQMEDEHALFGRTQLFGAVEFLTKHFKQEATLPDAIRLMKVAYELERLARGAATSKVDADVKIQVLPKEYVNISEDEIFSEP